MPETLLPLIMFAVLFVVFTVWNCISGNEITALENRIGSLEKQIREIRDHVIDLDRQDCKDD